MQNLRVRSEMESRLLDLPEFRGVSTEELLYRARVRLGLARWGAIRGIRVATRGMAIAVLVGLRDRTEYGLPGCGLQSARSRQ